MVEDGGDALLDAVNIQRISGGLGALERQLAVNGPPGAVQHLVEVRGVVAHDAQTPGQGGINMGVGIDESGHDDAALGINPLGVGVLGAEGSFFAHRDDFGALEGHGALFKIGLLRIAGNKPAIQ